MEITIFFRMFFLLTFLLSFPTKFYSQVLLNENFESFTIGAIQGQNGFELNSGGITQNDVQQYQIVSEGGNKFVNIITKPEFISYYLYKTSPLKWQNRIPGNDIIEVTYDMYTGDISNNTANGGLMLLKDGGNYQYIGNMMYYNTKRITAVSWDWDHWYVDYDLGDNSAINLEPRKWVRVKFSYNLQTNSMTFEGPGFKKSFPNFLYWKDDITDFYLTFDVEVNTPSLDQAMFGFDNIVIKAVATETPLATTDVNVDGDFSIYPNPAQQYISIKYSGKFSTAYIYDATGKRSDAQIQNGKIDVKNLPSGLYILGIKTDKGFKSSKFIKK